VTSWQPQPGTAIVACDRMSAVTGEREEKGVGKRRRGGKEEGKKTEKNPHKATEDHQGNQVRKACRKPIEFSRVDAVAVLQHQFLSRGTSSSSFRVVRGFLRPWAGDLSRTIHVLNFSSCSWNEKKRGCPGQARGMTDFASVDRPDQAVLILSREGAFLGKALFGEIRGPGYRAKLLPLSPSLDDLDPRATLQLVGRRTLRARKRFRRLIGGWNISRLPSRHPLFYCFGGKGSATKLVVNSTSQRMLASCREFIFSTGALT